MKSRASASSKMAKGQKSSDAFSACPAASVNEKGEPVKTVMFPALERLVMIKNVPASYVGASVNEIAMAAERSIAEEVRSVGGSYLSAANPQQQVPEEERGRTQKKRGNQTLSTTSPLDQSVLMMQNGNTLEEQKQFNTPGALSELNDEDEEVNGSLLEAEVEEDEGDETYEDGDEARQENEGGGHNEIAVSSASPILTQPQVIAAPLAQPSSQPSKTSKSLSEQGTGGTNLVPFLLATREVTIDAKLKLVSSHTAHTASLSDVASPQAAASSSSKNQWSRSIMRLVGSQSSSTIAPTTALSVMSALISVSPSTCRLITRIALPPVASPSLPRSRTSTSSPPPPLKVSAGRLSVDISSALNALHAVSSKTPLTPSTAGVSPFPASASE
eukprot:GDKJ01015317.1.p1 GENE.GDKJ01015317.1~~GDKJ01015317.1.p1  ORF type:complete len:445 (-),score=162.12 GDKJ01015317.1:555-1718(-)